MKGRVIYSPERLTVEGSIGCGVVTGGVSAGAEGAEGVDGVEGVVGAGAVVASLTCVVTVCCCVAVWFACVALV